jgi:anti-anti-sigma factor
MSEPPLRHTTIRTEQGVLVLTITAMELQTEPTADTLLQEMLAAVEQHAAGRVVIDLQNIKYISSVAFRPFLFLRRKLQETGGRMILCGLSSVVGDVFYTTRMVSRDGSFAAPFEMEADAAAAIVRLQNAADQNPTGG